MKFPIPTKKRRLRLVIGFKVYRPTSLIIIGKDAEHRYTTYISRELSITEQHFKNGVAYREVTIPFPLSPQFLMLELWDANNKGLQSFQVVRLDLEVMEEREVWEHEDIHQFIPFANWFAEKAGYLPVGMYDSPDRSYLIDYRKVITNRLGEPLLTPARTSRNNGRIEASKSHFMPLSVPIRWFILMHERKHFQLPTRVEKEADLSALRVFLDYGFPKIEAIYACTVAMKAYTTEAKEAKLERLKDIHSYIDQYIEQQNSIAA